jgi:hypothetical protein
VGWSLCTDIIEMNQNRVVMKATVRDENDRVIATGIAYEEADSSYINKTSYIENCETSAWGRALGNLGIGITSSIASKEEIENATKRQKAIIEKADARLSESYDSNNNEHKSFLFKKMTDAKIPKDQMKMIADRIEERKTSLDEIEAHISEIFMEG